MCVLLNFCLLSCLLHLAHKLAQQLHRIFFMVIVTSVQQHCHSLPLFGTSSLYRCFFCVPVLLSLLYADLQTCFIICLGCGCWLQQYSLYHRFDSCNKWIDVPNTKCTWHGTVKIGFCNVDFDKAASDFLFSLTEFFFLCDFRPVCSFWRQ